MQTDKKVRQSQSRGGLGLQCWCIISAGCMPALCNWLWASAILPGLCFFYTPSAGGHIWPRALCKEPSQFLQQAAFIQNTIYLWQIPSGNKHPFSGAAASATYVQSISTPTCMLGQKTGSHAPKTAVGNKRHLTSYTKKQETGVVFYVANVVKFSPPFLPQLRYGRFPCSWVLVAAWPTTVWWGSADSHMLRHVMFPPASFHMWKSGFCRRA